jgi:hypothetical protein
MFNSTASFDTYIVAPSGGIVKRRFKLKLEKSSKKCCIFMETKLSRRTAKGPGQPAGTLCLCVVKGEGEMGDT